jgi:vacuolar-type H+-ATPase subunit I/STV1
MANSELITADNIGSSLSFNKKLDSYEENVTKLGDVDAEINEVKREMDDLLKNNPKRSKESNAYYPPNIQSVGYDFKEVGGNAGRLFVYVHKERNEEYDKLYNSFGDLSKLSRDSVAMGMLEEKFKGLRDYIAELSVYFYSPFDEVDEEATNTLRAEFTALEKRLRKLETEQDKLNALVNNVERFINTAEKVSNIGKRNRELSH